MKLLQSIINEGGMKDAAMDLIDKASKGVPNTGDFDAYLMKVVAKVLELDTEKLFKGDFKAVEDMVKAQLGDKDGLEEATGDEKFDKMIGSISAAADGAKEMTKKDLSKLLNELDDDARHAGVILNHDARYKSVDFSWEHQILYWVTQATSKPADKAEAARAIADEMSERGFRGWTVKVTIRDDYVGNGDESKWQVAKTK